MTRSTKRDVAAAAEHWDSAFETSASVEQRASSYALANPLFHELYLSPHFGPGGIDWLEWARLQVAPDAPAPRALVLGCGIGDGAVEMHQRGVAQAVHGVDISGKAIEQGRALAEAAGIAEHVTFEATDFNHLEGIDGRYDLVFTVQSLHHSLDLDGTLEVASRALRPGGRFIANEYIGPNRWQFTTRQLFLIKALLTALPRRLRRKPDGTFKGRVGRPTIAWMMATDPSEAAFSEDIPDAILRHFDLDERIDYGCGITLPVLDGIIGGFDRDNPADMRWLQRVIATERTALRRGWVPSSCAVFLATKRT